MARDPTNAEIADLFDESAGLLEAQHASPHRVRAWRSGADAIRGLERPLADVFRAEGVAGLEDIEHIGHRLARVIIEILRTGRSQAVERLRGEVTPHEIFADLPGIGEVLAERIHHDLGVETLEELEVAAHDGRLEALDGFGPRRAAAIRELLAARLSRSARRRASGRAPKSHRPPSVALLLEEDRRYRRLAAEGKLRTIAPRRFNPDNRAWLPILHEDREDWSFTALYSNTALAHKLHKCEDWVVIFYEHDHSEGRATVVTEWRGRLAGRRVVRGRERACAAFYAEEATSRAS